MGRLRWVILVAAFGCSASPPGQQEANHPQWSQRDALRTMKAQAEELGRAILAEDHAKVVDRTHPTPGGTGRRAYANDATT